MVNYVRGEKPVGRHREKVLTVKRGSVLCSSTSEIASECDCNETSSISKQALFEKAQRPYGAGVGALLKPAAGGVMRQGMVRRDLLEYLSWCGIELADEELTAAESAKRFGAVEVKTTSR